MCQPVSFPTYTMEHLMSREDCVLIERKIVVMKLQTVLLAGLVSVGLLMIGANCAFAGGYFSAGNPGGLPAVSSYPPDTHAV